MKHYINHRINTVEQLSHVALTNGIELDIRYHENELVLHHDPFRHHETAPEKLEDLLKAWHHNGPMILNVKTEGVEKACIALMNKYNIKNWFFLDLSMPYFAIYAETAKNKEIEGFGPDNLAVRFSEREPLEYALAFAGKANWVWVDCFTHLPLNNDIYTKLKDAGYKICIVSPELQKHSMNNIAAFQKQLAGMDIDAVCTKRPDIWGQTTTEENQTYLNSTYPVT